MKRIIYILTGIVLLSLSSCSDFLEPKSQSEYVPKDANALQEMLIGSAYPKQDKSNFLLPFLSFLDDDIQFHKTDYEFSINSLKNIEAKQAVYTWQPDMFFIMERNGYPLQNIWEGYYNYILGANAALDYIGDVNGTEAEKNYVIAQSLGLRVFLYMENWKDAAIYANKVIKDWSFALVDLNNLPSPTVAEPYYNFTSLKSSEVIWLYGSVSDLTVFNDESVEYEEEGYFGNTTPITEKLLSLLIT